MQVVSHVFKGVPQIVEGCAVRFGGKTKPIQTSRSLIALNLDAAPGLTKKLKKEAKRRKAPLKDTIMQILAEAVGLKGSRDSQRLQIHLENVLNNTFPFARWPHESGVELQEALP